MVAVAPAVERRHRQVEEANRSGRTPVVLVHGLWLLPSSWERWGAVFAEAGYPPVFAGWPGDAATVDEARAHPDALAGTSVEAIVDELAATIAQLDAKPAIVGHSFGGLFAQMLADRGLAAATVAIGPAPFRGVLPLPRSALKAGSPVLRDPRNRGRTVALTETQFRFAFANAVAADEARQLYSEFAVPAPGAPLFQAAVANLNPRTRVRVDTGRADRGPLLIVAGTNDNTIPVAMAKAAYERQRRNPAVTEYAEVEGRGHALTIDSGWREVADLALAFIRRFA
jgi:pimeloyl-ACP methyl ester carboxylesterase